jgi:hypothetical protein
MYNDLVKTEEKNNICIDFDGVIHNDYLGFHDGTLYGNIIDGAKESIVKLSKSYKIIIFTAKAKPDRPLVNNKTGTELIWDWLKENEIDSYISEVTSEKPRGLVYIDDKAIRFTDWTSTMNMFDNLYGETR